MQIYIHIPFCELKCYYCRFASVGNTQKFLIEKYVRYLMTSILNSFSSKKKEATISSIYFGGGTPSVLSLSQLEGVFLSLKEKFDFAKDIEITLETTPDRVTRENLIGWKKLGINRLSIGIQTLNEKSLDAIGRGKKGDIEKALKTLDENVEMFGKNISLDFIIGLPYVRKGETLSDIKHVLENYDFIKHISVYMLEDYYNADKIVETKYDKKIYPKDWGKLGLGEEQYLAEYVGVKKYLESEGFGRYEISNYAKQALYPPHSSGTFPQGEKDYRCKHNMGYWNHSDILAFGLGAYGYINNTRYANSENFEEYYKGERLFEEKLSKDDVFIERVMFQLRTSGLEKEVYKRLKQEKLEEFISEGFLEKKSDKIVLSDKGVLVMDYLLGEVV